MRAPLHAPQILHRAVAALSLKAGVVRRLHPLPLDSACDFENHSQVKHVPLHL